MDCYHCHSPLEDDLKAKPKITFRSVCESCNFDLHVCLSCKFYSPGKPNDCCIPNIDKVIDKEKNNFCDEFVYNDQPFIDAKSKNQKKQIVKKLFKDEDDNQDQNDQTSTKSFEGLFKN